MKKIILVVLDGWGISKETVGNAIANASTPNMDDFVKSYPNTALQASGISAGLPWGKMGNSEVGHLILGAGKILYQNLLKVSLSIRDRSFFKNEVLLNAIKHARVNNSNIHLMGLVSCGGVHSHIDHLYALLELLKINKVDKNKVFIHVFTDGRDTEAKSAVGFVSDLIKNIKEEKWPGRIASIMGRYYAMDRNKNWERTKLAYYCLTKGICKKESDVVSVINKYYAENITDEFIKPTLILDKDDNFAVIKENDSVIFFNIREDRSRQLTKFFVQDNFNSFNKKGKLRNLCFVTMVEYEKGLPVNVAFLPENVKYPLGRILSDIGMKQFRIAETEKYAHVTYFFNGGREKPFKNEFRKLIPSPSVSMYDKVPEMSAGKITEKLIKEIESNRFGFILANYANADMVGHTGNYQAAVKAVEFVDKCLGKVYKYAMKNRMTLVITADHGNADQMFDTRTGEKITEHSTNPVPFIIIDQDSKLKEKKLIDSCIKIEGMLSDVAPTILDIYGIKKTKEMTGISLLDSLF